MVSSHWRFSVFPTENATTLENSATKHIDYNKGLEQEFAFASYYQSHMVLQQKPARAAIWGYAPMQDVGHVVKVVVMGTGHNSTSTYQGNVTKG